MVSSSAYSESLSDLVFFSSPQFSITESELRLYLRRQVNPDGSVAWGSEEQVRQGLSDLYALKVFSAEANEQNLVSEEEATWIAYYQVAIEGVRRLIQAKALEIMDGIDWEAEASERYIASKEEFLQPASLTVRHLLIKAGVTRSQEAAFALVGELVPEQVSALDFEGVVKQYSEEPGASETGGLLPAFGRGEMVPEFEQAAFALSEKGELSAPVLTDYGVHVIQLVDRTEQRIAPFNQVKQKLIEELKSLRWEQTIASIKASAQSVRPEGLVIHQDNIDEFMLSLDDF